jgi:hypothetical protein
MVPAVQSLADHAALVASLRRELGADALIETHISSVLLAGDCAYKLKKPVNFGFVDFSTLLLRTHFCAEELRLNRRTAPQLYLDVQPVTGTLDAPQVGGAGEPIDHLLRMRRFDPAQVLDQVAARGELTAAHIDALSTAIADLHRAATCAEDDSPFGTPETVQRWVEGNLALVRADCHAAIDRARVDALADWTRHRFERQRALIESRRRAGFVREGHGDLHLGNVVLIDGRPVLFDALEFNEELRWIDVVSDVAFLFMDLLDHGQSALAWRMLSGYLEATGDYDGVALLHFYAVYRALVRAKVALLRVQQPAAPPIVRVRAQRTFAHYLALAEGMAQSRQSPQLVVMTGLSGSGKSTVALELAAQLGALRVRSDVERKRLAGIEATGRGAEALYAPRMTELTYDRLQSLAATLLEARVSVVIDAASLRADERRDLARIATAHGCPATVVACEAPPALLEARVAARTAAGRDPSDATLDVLARQRLWQELRAPGEPPHLRIDTDCTPVELTARCAALARQLRG